MPASSSSVLHIRVSCISSLAPTAILDIPPEKMGRVLGVGGMRLKGIADEVGAHFTMLEDDQLFVFAPSQDNLDEFQERVERCLKEEVRTCTKKLTEWLLIKYYE